MCETDLMKFCLDFSRISYLDDVSQFVEKYQFILALLDPNYPKFADMNLELAQEYYNAAHNCLQKIRLCISDLSAKTSDPNNAYLNKQLINSPCKTLALNPLIIKYKNTTFSNGDKVKFSFKINGYGKTITIERIITVFEEDEEDDEEEDKIYNEHNFEDGGAIYLSCHGNEIMFWRYNAGKYNKDEYEQEHVVTNFEIV
jgi:hypothetical protein